MDEQLNSFYKNDNKLFQINFKLYDLYKLDLVENVMIKSIN